MFVLFMKIAIVKVVLGIFLFAAHSWQSNNAVACCRTLIGTITV